MRPFVWKPGNGIDPKALKRLQDVFPPPAQPMGEAWFMGERRIFHELTGDIASLTVSQLQKVLESISSGASCFGLYDEWNDWYHHLLGHLIPRSHACWVDPLLEYLVTAFFALYPDGLNKPPYRNFDEDVLNTLGRCMMEPECWDGNDIAVGRVLHRSPRPNKLWGWWDASGDFSASMFLCLKYLPPDLIESWFKSVLAIPSPHWRAQLLVWLVGAHGFFTGKIRWPSELRNDAYPSVDWAWSHCLRADMASSSDVTGFLPRAAGKIVLETAYRHFTEDVYLDWIGSISAIAYLETELALIPATFESLYMKHGEI
ncbi:MAG: hypothetical protein EA357_02620 [Micavibrio sp.]|nr:MAG: hypothetical protein EA357_02620 [Micavibrio sp.]